MGKAVQVCFFSEFTIIVHENPKSMGVWFNAGEKRVEV